MKTRVSMAALAAAIGSLVTSVPAQAQTQMSQMPATTTNADNGGLLWVWVWILVIGVIAIVGGAAAGNMGGRR